MCFGQVPPPPPQPNPSGVGEETSLPSSHLHPRLTAPSALPSRAASIGAGNQRGPAGLFLRCAALGTREKERLWTEWAVQRRSGGAGPIQPPQSLQLCFPLQQRTQRARRGYPAPRHRGAGTGCLGHACCVPAHVKMAVSSPLTIFPLLSWAAACCTRACS